MMSVVLPSSAKGCVGYEHRLGRAWLGEGGPASQMAAELADGEAVNRYQVGIFDYTTQSGKTLLRAYTLWFNPSWPGCCLHQVEAETGQEAKVKAKNIHRESCMTNGGQR